MSGAAVTVPLANANPVAEGNNPAGGAADLASRMDHVHPRLTATASGVLNASGEATIVFTRTFSTKPAFISTYIETADNQPVIIKLKSWTQDAQNNYIGCVIKGYRSQTIPTNLVSLLLGGVFNLFNASAVNVEYSIIALQSS